MFRVSADLPFQNEIEHKSTGLSNLYLAAFTGAQAPPFAGYGWHHRRVVLLVSILGVTISKEEKKWTLHNCIKTAFKTPQSNNKKQSNKETARETMFNEWDQRNGDKVALHSSRWPDRRNDYRKMLSRVEWRINPFLFYCASRHHKEILLAQAFVEKWNY